MPLLIYFSLYLVIIDFHGLVWSPEKRRHQEYSTIFFNFWFETVSEDE